MEHGRLETRKDGVAVVQADKHESSNQSDSHIFTSRQSCWWTERIDDTDESSMYVIYTRCLVALRAQHQTIGIDLEPLETV